MSDDALTEVLTDPESLRNRDDVPFTEETRAIGTDEFERRADWAGVAVIGVLDDALLLVEVGDGHGWMLPNGPVEPGDDFAAVAARVAEATTGVAATATGVERVHRKTYRTDDGRETTGHHVVFRGRPTAGTDIGDDPGLPGQPVETVAWRTEPPADADWDHEDFADDVRLFLA